MSAIDTAVILAAGRGIRLRPLTDTVPKAMLNVGGVPLLERTVKQSIEAGITKFIFIVGHLGDKIEEYFGSGAKWGVNCLYVKQSILNGTGGALKLAEQHVRDGFLLIFGDSYFGESSILLIQNSTWPNVIGVFEVSDPSRYGIVETRGDQAVISVTEKPLQPKSNLAIAGIYKFQQVIWPAIHRLKPSSRGELELPDAIQQLISSGTEFGAVRLPLMIDVGTIAELEKVRAI